MSSRCSTGRGAEPALIYLVTSPNPRISPVSRALHSAAVRQILLEPRRDSVEPSRLQILRSALGASAATGASGAGATAAGVSDASNSTLKRVIIDGFL